MKFRFDPYERRFCLRTLVPTGQEAHAFTADELFQFGIEEEYFLCDAHTLQVPSKTPESLFRIADFGTAGRIGREFLQAQIEVATEPHRSFEKARVELLQLPRYRAQGLSPRGLR